MNLDTLQNTIWKLEVVLKLKNNSKEKVIFDVQTGDFTFSFFTVTDNNPVTRKVIFLNKMLCGTGKLELLEVLSYIDGYHAGVVKHKK